MGGAMRAMLALLVAVCVASSANAADNGRPTGKNCDLAAPPAEAGEELNHGMTIRVYPRRRDIGPGYAGCQLAWIPHKNQWLTMSAVAIENGDPVRIWAPDEAQPPFLACRYKKGQVVAGDASSCPMARFLVMRSMAPGCVEKIRKEAASGARRPLGCEYE
jgi:hypothetical protein